MDTDNLTSEAVTDETVKKKKTSKPGIVYLSTIPPKMNVTQIRDYFSQFGDLNRSYLQPEKGQKKGKKNQVFTEGWIQFNKRRHAKKVATMLNNNPIGGKKKKQNYDFLWNIKYLPGLQWTHINERLAFERISRQQKERAEIAVAKKEASFFAASVNLNKRIKKGTFIFKSSNKETNDKQHSNSDVEIPSDDKNLKDEIDSSKSKPKGMSDSRLKLFQNLFQTE